MSNREKNPSAADITPENLEKAIDKYQRQDVMRMLKGGVLSGLDDETRAAICHRLAGLRSMEIMDVLSRQKDPFTADMLNLDFDVFQNRNFVRDVLNKYSKKFDCSDEEECNKLFALACTVDDEKTVKTLIRQKKASDSYALIGGASLPVFEQISLIQGGQIHDDTRVQIYLRALLSDDAEKNLPSWTKIKLTIS